MTELAIAQYRLFNQHLVNTALDEPGDLVRRLVAVQSQDFAAAKWAVGMRLNKSTETTLDLAFAQGQILRTHVLRPTWHFVSPNDIRWLLMLTAPRVHAVNGTMYRKLELDAAFLSRTDGALAKILAGRQLTRTELQTRLQKEGFVTGSNLRMTYIVMHAELNGVICSGARRGKQFTYALLEARAPNAKTLPRDAALAELARRYFVSRGPATVNDFAKWSGLTISDARDGLEAIKSDLEHTATDGAEYWFPAAEVPDPAQAARRAVPERSRRVPAISPDSPHALLLSIYDEYISAYKDRRAIISETDAAKVLALGNALSYFVVLDGRIIGYCRRALEKGSIVLEPAFFKPPAPAEENAFHVEAQRYGAFFGMPVSLREITSR